MVETPLAARVAAAMEFDEAEFDARVEAEADRLKSAVADGTFDSPDATAGMEYEFYAVDETNALARVPRDLLDTVGFEKELGIHNAEMQVEPRPLTPRGLAAQEAEVKADLAAAQTWADLEGLRLVSDGVWTIPPSGTTAGRYLCDRIEEDGVRIAANMSESIRHHVMSNPTGDREEVASGMRIDLPNASLSADTVLPQSLITSTQFHYRVPQATRLPTYFRYALRVAGPLLALAANSPFVPPDLYDDDADPETVVDDAWVESRIPVFETVMNRPDDSSGKVRFPKDLGSTEAAIDRVAADRTVVPLSAESADPDGEFAHFQLKRGTYWRWVRPVFDGETEAGANVRIEFRPLPAQPTVKDAFSLQAAFAGLLTGLASRDHPVGDLDWETAEQNFYAAMRDGLDADLAWITADGAETRDADELYDDLFAAARDGLELRGFSDGRIDGYLRPLRRRAGDGATPAEWKRREVRERLRDGASLEAAVHGMQRSYVDRQTGTLLDGSFSG